MLFGNTAIMKTKINPFEGEGYSVSPYNFSKEVISSFNLPEKIHIYDVTLRDGEQCPGVVFRKEDKITLAKTLDEIGVYGIEAGMPAVSEDDFNAVKEIANLGLNTKVKCFCRAVKSDIDLALKADVWGVVIELPSSEMLIKTGYQWPVERVKSLAIDASLYAKEHGLNVTFFGIDTTRASLEFIKDLYTTVINQGKADALAIVDTFGVASPWGFAYLVKKIKSWTNVPLETHCHNDMGLATINSISGVISGAEVVHTNLNGLGERSGGAALDEVVVALKLFFDRDLNVNYSELYKAARTTERLSGVKMSTMKPLVGENSFGYEAGIAVMFLSRFMDEGMAYRAYCCDPKIVGNKIKIVLGKKSGQYSIIYKLKEFGKTANNEQIKTILKRVKAESLKRKSEIPEEVFLKITQEVLDN
jgi:methanogen homocitrate synthase